MRRGFPLIAIVALAGCGGATTPVPSAASARGALQASLDAWKAGKTPPAFAQETSKPAVQAVDHEWASGQGLESYTIGQETAADGNQTFAVSLTLKGSKSPKDVRYMVFGTDPVHVYRDDDYSRMANMENNPAPPKKRR